MSVTTRLTDDDPGLGDGAKALLPLGLSPDDVNCPICVETISAPFVTSCGHTFCYECISMQLKHKNSCPSCGNYLTADNIYPNFLLNKILRKAATAPPTGRTSLLDQVKRLLADNMATDSGPSKPVPSLPHLSHQAAAATEPGAVQFGGGGWLGADAGGASGRDGGGRRRLRLRDIDAVLEALYDAREELERRESSDLLHLLMCFLEHAREQKARQMDELRRQLALLQYDITSVVASKARTNTTTSLHAPAAAPPPATHLHPLTPPVDPCVPCAVFADPCPAVSLPLRPTTAAAAAAAATAAAADPEPTCAAAGLVDMVAAAAATTTTIAASAADAATTTAAVAAGNEDRVGQKGDVANLCSPPTDCRFPSPAPPAAEPRRQTCSTTHQNSPKALQQESRQQQHPQHQQHQLQQQHHLSQQEQQQQQQRRPCPPMRRASWRLHTLTPAGGISSITLDTSGLTEPGQQAEAFCAAVQHALAAARGGTGANVSTTTASDGGSRGAAPLASGGDGGGSPIVRHGGSGAACSSGGGGDPPRAAQRLDNGNHNHIGIMDNVRGRTAADANGGGGGGPSRRMPRCGSADNFQMVTGAGGCDVRVGEKPPSLSCDGGGDSSVATGGTGGGGGDDCSALSGAAFPPPPPRQAPAAAAAMEMGGEDRKADSAAGIRSRAEVGARVYGTSPQSQPQASAAAVADVTDEGFVVQRSRRLPSPPSSSEDEMDVRERRRGRGRPVVGPHGSTNKVNNHSHPQQQTPGGPGVTSSLPLPAAATPAVVKAAPPPPPPLPQPPQPSWPHQQPPPANRVSHCVNACVGGVGKEGGDEAGVRAAKRRRMLSQFDLLERAYLQTRVGVGRKPEDAAASHARAPATAGHFQTAIGMAAASTATTQPLFPGFPPPHPNQPPHPPTHQSNMPPPSGPHNLLHHPHPHHQNTHGLRVTPAATTQTGNVFTVFTAAAAALPRGVAAAAAAVCGGAHPHRPPAGPGGRCNCEGHHGDGGGAGAGAGAGAAGDLSSFGAILAAATQYSQLELLAEIPNYEPGSGSGNSTAPNGAAAAGSNGGLQILSSIEFDLSDDLFATAGVVPRILVYDYQALLSTPAPPRPVVELTARSKLSCLSFSHAVQSHLLAADYQGGVSLWDTTARMQIQDYEAHERRVWGVDFSPARSHCFASGSDDGMVKIWSTRQPGSCLALELRGNVCSVEWHPSDPNLLAVGSALHAGFVYDVRQPAAPLHTLLGHRKAVSYVRWLSNGQELVTASTDSSLKLWSLNTAQPPLAFTAAAFSAGGGAGGGGPHSYAPHAATAATLPPFLTAGDTAEQGPAAGGAATAPVVPALASGGGTGVGGGGSILGGSALVRSFSGHVNERNFVGLSTRGDYIACGSESHEVFVYTRALPQPALRFACNGRLPRPDRPGAGIPSGHFVTALQWRRSSPHLLVANSAGYIWLLGMKL